MKKFNQLAKKNYSKFTSSIKTKVAIKFPKKKLFFFLPKISLALKGLMNLMNRFVLISVNKKFKLSIFVF